MGTWTGKIWLNLQQGLNRGVWLQTNMAKHFDKNSSGVWSLDKINFHPELHLQICCQDFKFSDIRNNEICRSAIHVYRKATEVKSWICSVMRCFMPELIRNLASGHKDDRPGLRACLKAIPVNEIFRPPSV